VKSPKTDLFEKCATIKKNGPVHRMRYYNMILIYEPIVICIYTKTLLVNIILQHDKSNLKYHNPVSSLVNLGPLCIPCIILYIVHNNETFKGFRLKVNEF